MRVLLLEDNDSDAALVLRELRKTGLSFEPTRAVTRQEFEAALQDPPPDLILSDYSLPQFDGLAALALCRATCPDVPFIFVSGALGEERAIESLKSGATDYVLKDRLGRLGPAVKRAIEEANERRLRQAAEAQVAQQAVALGEANALLQVQFEETRRQAERAEAWARTAESGREQLRMLSRRLVELQEEERQALSRELHDETGQVLTVLKLGLGALEREGGDPAAVRRRTELLQQTTDTLGDTLHRLAMNLRPASLDRYGLVAALEGLLADFRRRTGLIVTLEAKAGEARLSGEVETAFYRIVQEALTNAMRHARAQEVNVEVSAAGGEVSLTIRDDGCGFDVDDALARGRLGLVGMRERAEMLGGALEITSAPGTGTCVTVTAPTHPASLPLGAADATAPLSQREARPAESLPAAELARAKVLGEALIDITFRIAGISSVEEVLQIVLRDSAEAIGCETAHVMLREPGCWRVVLRYGLPVSHFMHPVPDEDSPTALWVERNRQVLVSNDPASDPRMDPRQVEELSVRSIAVIPLARHDHFTGILTYANRTAATPFRPSEVAFLSRLAALVSMALENLHLREVEAQQAAKLAERVEELDAIGAELREANTRLQLHADLLAQSTDHLERRVRERTEELFLQAERLAILHEIDRAILSARAPGEIARATAERVLSAIQADLVGVGLIDLQQQELKVIASAATGSTLFEAGTRLPLAGLRLMDAVQAGRLAAVPDVTEMPRGTPWKEYVLERGILSLTVAPLVVSGKVIGVMTVGRSQAGTLSPDSITLVTHVADSLAVAIQHAQLDGELRASQAQLRSLMKWLVDRQEHERRHVADLLYNEAAQVLAALKMQLGLGQTGATAHAIIEAAEGALDEIIRDLQTVAMGIRPLILDRYGLISAIRQYAGAWAQRNEIATVVVVEGVEEVRLDPQTETAVYWVLQEALSNIAQHAHARSAQITLTKTAGRVTVRVEDDGVGFDAAAVMDAGTGGLLAMSERAGSVGATLTVESRPDAGTAVTLTAPVQVDADEEAEPALA